ncbi:DEAD/DEAH box helicase [Methylobacterium longum]|uniref:DEAD/DEAH box helicase n=1 Tax=Methylobacterium longum TaxID=767694 RepID=A0ABT8AT62_9HYPH|nr:DEAD/DEAH box helicase [Methylobacterium longum]MDN3572800.1 DEAD/DEAH box helicase [Methylobacterium longum]GJE10075.1 ATP-dependent RNA helicase RhlE [Methylobacterium longum]
MSSPRFTTPVATLDAVRERATEAVLGQSGLNHPVLAAEIRRRFACTDAEAGALVQQPVVEAALPYVTGTETLAALAGDRLHPAVVNALTAPGPDRRYAFPRDLKPYRHQREAWALLSDPTPQSVLVTSGTGSGKTECFLVPLLHDLACEADRVGRLKGVRAIALYPLNALIASQQERLREWTAPFAGRIRFGLYNGDMPEDDKFTASSPEQVGDRRTLRDDPPPILVTNVTMLEYMTVRHQDRPLLEASRGQLRWIILDEAHSYGGSAAAEIALLIRRALLAFGVTPAQVRFVATSATIGEGKELLGKLRRFLRDVAGVSDERVHVVVGERRLPDLPDADGPRRLTADGLGDAGILARNPGVHALIRGLTVAPLAWESFTTTARAAGVEPQALLEALARRGSDGREPLLPLRVHGFIRAVPGLWACLRRECAGRPPGDWPFGALLHARADVCPHCAGPMLEIVSCSECGEPYLDAVERDERLRCGTGLSEKDEFASASETESVPEAVEDEGAADADPDEAGVPARSRPDIARLIAVRGLPGGRPLYVTATDGLVRDGPTEDSVTLSVHDRGPPEHCPACAASARPGQTRGTVLRSFRYGAPFLIGNAAPVLLDGVAPRDADPALLVPPPAEGRQLLSFTDSRQGTARFAAALQAASERNAVRAVIYHAVQDSLRPPAIDVTVAEKLDAEIRQLELVIAQVPTLSEMLKDKREQRAALARPSSDGLLWRRVRDILVRRPEVETWMRQVWRLRDRRFDQDAEAFATFLLLRELARRPRRANALEPLGLARLRFADIDRMEARHLPDAFRVRGRTIADWRDFLHLLVTINIRNPFAVRIDQADQHWLIRKGFPRILVGPDRKTAASHELAWPKARPVGRPAIAVRLLAQGFGLDVSQAEHRAEIDEVLRAAWSALTPLLARPGEGALYALDFETAHIAPVVQAFACPINRRLLDTTFLGLSPYATERRDRSAGERLAPISMPVHPNPYLLPERGGVGVVQSWLDTDERVATLRVRGLWGDLHDRIALGSPYARAAEHSAQQPPTRLRRYEDAFKRGEINVLNCSTTMEMGVDIGSVSSVMMTNVPPSIANYRQRVGRAGRRGQGLSTALTYARDTPLDRETFRDPVGYLGRRIEAPKVTLDSRRIVQRHVNALLLAAWFREAQGQVLKTRAGDFYGCPTTVPAVRDPAPPSTRFRAWVVLPSTSQAHTAAIETLLRGSALAGHPNVCAAAAEAVREAEADFLAEWDAIQAQAAGLDREAARKALGMQVKRMCGEYLLGELADSGVLPGHGFPSAVVPFVHKDDPDDEAVPQGDRDSDRFRRRGYPTRNLDLAIRDYAPGAEVVVDGLVYGSAGVTLNWQRPAAAAKVAEVQSIKWFWQCTHCAAADTTRLFPERCAACGQALEGGDIRRFLQPAGFTVDPREKPHAEIEQVRFVEPEPERVVARGAAWKPFLTPARGRLRASHEGLVFYASSGEHGAGYAVCLECGRAEAHAHPIDPAARPLRDHRPLRFTKADIDGYCPGNGRGFAVQTGLALGHDITTDVAEIQPAALASEGAAWALASGLREALTRRLGIETGEIGLSVVRHVSTLGGATHSVYLYDRASGGAGFTPRLVEMFEELLHDVRVILDCRRPGCIGGCSACVLASDLHRQAEMLDRRTALDFVKAELEAIAGPSPEDRITEGAVLARDVADEIATQVVAGGEAVILWPAEPFDPATLVRPRLLSLLQRLREAGTALTLCASSDLLAQLDPAQRLALRDAAVRHGLRLATGDAPRFPNSARAIAALSGGRIWASRDDASARFGDGWGLGGDAPVVTFLGRFPACQPFDPDCLLPRQGTRFIEPGRRLDGPSRGLGERFLALLKPELEAAGLWRPGQLTAMSYSDRYVRSPLVALLVARVTTRLSTALSGSQRRPFLLTTTPLSHNDGLPHRLSHDWRTETDRTVVLRQLFQAGGLDLELKVGPCSHSRRLTLSYADGPDAVLVFDQGFGFLKPQASAPRYDFQATAPMQAKNLNATDVSCSSDGASYIVVVTSK